MDGDTFGREVTSLLPNLYAAALHFTRDAADAEDLVAETVAKAWGALHTLQDATRFRCWLLRILTNTYFAQYRARSVRPSSEPLPDEDREDFSLFEKLHQPFLLWWGNPEQQFLDRLLREDLERAVAALPEPFGDAVVLVDLEGCTYAEVAETLDVPIGTVRSRLARGRAMLQKTLWLHACDAGVVDVASRPAGQSLT
jgi:RNA polymerase sigma-70 factor (ECF subfamily)